MTLLEKMKDTFPDTDVNILITVGCVKTYGYKPASECLRGFPRFNCEKCWKQEYEEQVHLTYNMLNEIRPHIERTCLTCKHFKTDDNKCSSCLAHGYTREWVCKW